jgi:LCP family protein required for cell wall assembly
MESTPPHDDSPDSSERWTGRARVSSPGRLGLTPTPGVSSTRGASSAPASSVGASSARGTARAAVATAPPRPATAGAAGPGAGGPGAGQRVKRRLKPRWGRIALVATLALALLVGGVALSGYLWLQSVNDGLKRTDAFSDIAGRPPKVVDGSLNILLLGSDSRDPDAPTSQPGQWRTDTILLMHIPASHDRAYLISLPRDLWVHVPASKNGQYGNQMAKINAAYAWGGISLMVQTVEEYTGVRMDHVALIDFGGFVKVTDALGGVDMTVDQTITSIHPPHRTFTKGLNHFNGAEALDYVRQRYQFADGDFSRIRHQQLFLKTILDKAASAGTLTSPKRLGDFISSVANAVTVDRDFSLLDLAWQFHGLRSNDLTFMTSPNLGSDTVDGQSVVVSDRQKALALYDAVAKDTLSSYTTKASPSSNSRG